MKTALETLVWEKVLQLLAFRSSGRPLNAKYCNRQLVQYGVFEVQRGKFSASDYPVLAKVFPSLVLLKPAVISFVSGMTGEV